MVEKLKLGRLEMFKIVVVLAHDIEYKVTVSLATVVFTYGHLITDSVYTPG